MSVIRQLLDEHQGNDVVFDPKDNDINLPLLEDSCWLEVKPADLEESRENGDTRYYLNGRLGLVEAATANKRLYGKKLMQREIGRLAEDMASRGVYGECDHPSDGRTKLSRVSHFVLGANINESNEIIGKIEIIPGTTNGDQILAIARRGGRLGVSSRGFGSVVPDKDGNHVVQEDYRLVTWDVVADPANAGAHPKFVSEEKEVKPMDIQQLIKEHPEVVETLRSQIMEELGPESRAHARDALKSEFDQKLKEAGTAIREEVEQEIRTALLSDPEVAGAKQVVDSIKEAVRPFLFSDDENAELARLNERIQVLEGRIAEQDKALQEAENENTELAVATRQLAYHLYIEQLEEPYVSKNVLERLGNLDQFETTEAFQSAVECVKENIDKELEESREREATLQSRDEEIERLKEERNKALAIGNQGLVRAYLEKKIGRHPHAQRVREYVTEAAPTTKDQVDSLIAAYDSDHPLSEEYVQLRRGLRVEGEESGQTEQLTEDDDIEICGVPMSQLLQ